MNDEGGGWPPHLKGMLLSVLPLDATNCYLPCNVWPVPKDTLGVLRKKVRWDKRCRGGGQSVWGDKLFIKVGEMYPYGLSKDISVGPIRRCICRPYR